MIKAILIDDEPLARMIVKEYLQGYAEIEVVAECSDGFEGIKAISEHNPGLIFLDIQMPKINGFEMLELIENPPAVIFTTAFDEYALKAFEANAIDYLLKPFSKERFDKAVQKWISTHKEEKNPAELETLLETAATQPLEHSRVVVKIHTAAGVFLKNKTMGFFEKTLKPELFTRIHRSYIIRLDEINKIEPMEKDSHVAILRNGDKIPVSKSGYARLKEVLGI